MLMRNWLKSWKQTSRRSLRRRSAAINSAAGACEVLEDRMLLSGVALLKDVTPGGFSSNPSGFTGVGDTVFFAADDGEHGTELWKSDGTAAGTVMVKNISAGAEGSYPEWLTNVNGTLYFAAAGAGGFLGDYELWKSDGTAAGTVRVKDIVPGEEASNPHRLIDVNGTLYFLISPGNNLELWKSDGTAAGTKMVMDIGGNRARDPDLTVMNGILYFSAWSDEVFGYELWRTDGTPDGTYMVKDIWTLGSGPRDMVNVNGALFFQAFDDGPSLWKSDGTEAGTVRLADLGLASDFTNVNGTLFFSNSFDLWKSDGTPEGTVLVKTQPQGLFSPSELTAIGDTLYFAANEWDFGEELWKSDGTTAGTVKVKEIYAGGWSARPLELTNVNGTLYFQATDDDHGAELWKSDGTEAGTVLVADIFLGFGGSHPQELASINGVLYFAAHEFDNGREPYRLDTNTPVNRPPVIVAGGSKTYIENAPPTLLAPTAVVTDLDSANLDGGTLTVSIVNAHSSDRLSIVPQGDAAGQIGVSGNQVRFGGTLIGTFTGGVGTAPLVVTFNADSSPAAAQALVRRVGYSSTLENPTGSKTIRFVLTDGDGGTSNIATVIVNLKPVNDPPVIGNIGGAVAYLEGAVAKQLMPSATVTDPDSANFGGGRLTISYVGGAQATDRLSILNQGTAAGQIGVAGNEIRFGNVLIGTFAGGVGGGLVVTFNANATREAVQATLRRVAYASVSLNPPGSRTLHFVLTDGDGGASQPVTKTVNIQSVNVAPVIGNVGSAVGYIENAVPTQLMGSATVTDPDSPNFGGGTLTISITGGGESTDRLTILSQGFGAGQIGATGAGQIRFSNIPVGTFTGGVGSTPLVITFNANATLAGVQALLRRIGYSSLSENAIGTRTVRVVVTDGDGGTSAPVTKTVKLTPVNDAPVLVVGGTPTPYNPGGPPILLAPSGTITDADSPNFAGGKLTVSYVSGGESADRLTILHQGTGAGQIGVSGSGLTFGGVSIGTFAGGVGTQALVITFNVNATAAAAQAVLRRIAYSSVSATPGSQTRIPKFQLTDGDGGTSGQRLSEARSVALPSDDAFVAAGAWADV